MDGMIFGWIVSVLCLIAAGLVIRWSSQQAKEARETRERYEGLLNKIPPRYRYDLPLAEIKRMEENNSFVEIAPLCWDPFKDY